MRAPTTWVRAITTTQRSSSDHHRPVRSGCNPAAPKSKGSALRHRMTRMSRIIISSGIPSIASPPLAASSPIPKADPPDKLGPVVSTKVNPPRRSEKKVNAGGWNHEPTPTMTILLRNLALPLDRNEEDLALVAAAVLGVDRDGLSVHAIVKKSLDARRSREPRFLYTLALDCDSGLEAELLGRDPAPVEPFVPPPRFDVRIAAPIQGPPPTVVGCGPAGLFAAWRLVGAGLEPVVIERGPDVTERTKRWNRFLRGDAFDPESNLLFGEGGAGTYSDGKLYTRIRDPRVHEILEVLAANGAPRSILYDAKPHIGSNLLPSVVRRLRRQLAERGADFRFSTRMTGLISDGGRLRGIELESGGVIETSTVFLGLGHSARESIRGLHRDGVAMERKPFQLGARIEHPQEVINRMQYGVSSGHPLLPPADYRLVAKLPGGDLFSFCMCPGGEILPATEKPGFICVNGASPLGRRGRFANSGFVITLEPDRFPGNGPLAGIELQEEIEARAAALAEHPFGAPALRLGDFVGERVTAGDLPDSSYPMPLTVAPFEEFLPQDVVDALRAGLTDLCGRLPVLRHPDSIIVGPESRSSCPVRIVRDPDSLQSTSTPGLYPMGEGAGYAGGIVSAAVDGLRCAEAFVSPVDVGDTDRIRPFTPSPRRSSAPQTLQPASGGSSTGERSRVSFVLPTREPQSLAPLRAAREKSAFLRSAPLNPDTRCRVGVLQLGESETRPIAGPSR